MPSTTKPGSRVITLTTDFGGGSPYVAAMKGVILSINPHATLVDITHDIPPQDIRQGAVALADASVRFPADSIHVAVVDPGVGTQRNVVYARFGQQHFIAPDNGLLDRLAAQQPPDKIVTLTNPKYWLPDVSTTFHGRDMMAPVAAHLSLGTDPDDLGTPQDKLIRLDWPEVRIVPGEITGSVESIDSFGNLITDIDQSVLSDCPKDESVRVCCDEHETYGIFQTYGDQPEMTLIALIGSSGKLELAIVNESAKIMLGVSPGAPVMVSW
jgi:S-adenosylmethionine hydrolase